VPVVGNGGDGLSPGHPAAAPLTARPDLSAARCVSALPGTADEGPSTRVCGRSASRRYGSGCLSAP